MKNAQVIRAWKDVEYRLGLSQAERGLLPAHPSGAIELSEAELAGASGGTIVVSVLCRPISWFCQATWVCPSLTICNPYHIC